MPLVALDEDGTKVFAWEVTERKPLYTCKGCGGRLSFMDCTLKIKHFRHLTKCDCESEPETEDHVWGKQLVYQTIQAMKNHGIVELEHPIDSLRADVYWEGTWITAAIEIQASNYNISYFEDKIYEYARKGMVVIYLLVGDNFRKETKSFVYSLKEIEKRLFVKKDFPGCVYAGYLLPSGTVLLPYFQEKWARGGGDCTNRFISMRRLEQRVSLTDFLIDAVYVPPPKIECKHQTINYVPNFEKIKRYKVVCTECGKFMKWLPNKEAEKLGLEL
ncbi:competence protein CoiA-related protein [Geotalea daltonii FRC-32]|uniref:Competence protein CoiA-related protein n=1 Tax=Geotalea daltonii (strain DSM 22248 / JCM 15807 / FRC-32) TaxID=316067 RepID=B9M106_GEODF|nr:competence protein CoiA family protein [Geotalea daltonii]ACM19076.1 competence protein CoiA-related protein [Geotalea daltonii FRC-32]